jgi:hypothetical protein
MNAIVEANLGRRVKQVHECFLNAQFRHDYYSKEQSTVQQRMAHTDFAIGLGGALSGGSGLGILAVPQMAWACGALTTISTILAIAKASYNWPERLKRSTDLATHYDLLASDYMRLIDDLNVAQVWDSQSEARHSQLRLRFDKPPTDYPFRTPSVKELREIQNAIKNRIKYKEWWKPIS